MHGMTVLRTSAALFLVLAAGSASAQDDPKATEQWEPVPKVVSPGMLASAALELLNTSRITALFVVDKGKPVGVVHVHDLLRAGVA